MIAYLAVTNIYLKVAHCSNAACTNVVISTVDSAGAVGWYTSIAKGVDGFGLISYYDLGAALKVVHCSNIFCDPNYRVR